jgi:hypothetical protein
VPGNLEGVEGREPLEVSFLRDTLAPRGRVQELSLSGARDVREAVGAQSRSPRTRGMPTL